MHQDAVVGRGDQLLECQRLFSRQKADVGHANHWKAVPALSAQGPTGAILGDGVRGFSRTEIAGEQSVGDDGCALRGDAFVVETECSQARAVLLARVRDDVHHLAAIAQSAQLVEREERRAREVRLHTQHPVEFDGMPDGFVNLQSQL